MSEVMMQSGQFLVEQLLWLNYWTVSILALGCVLCDPHELRSISSHLQLHVRPTFNLFPCTICLLYKIIMGGCRHKVL